MNWKQVMRVLCFAAAVLPLSAMSDPITVRSVLFDCDGDALTVGPPFGPAAPCTVEPISGTPPVGTQLDNGAFLIFQTELAPVLGDGIDERTRGLFDFRADPDYAAFSSLLADPHGKIVAATIQFVLDPKDPLTSTDQFTLENISPFRGDPEIGDQLENNPFLSNGVSKLVTLDLLDYFSLTQLENFLSNGTGNLADFLLDGRIGLLYGDDAILSAAGMVLTANVPEPGTVTVLGLALAGLGVARRRKLQ